MKLVYVDIDQNTRYIDKVIPINSHQQSNSSPVYAEVLENSDIMLTHDYGIRFPANNPNISFDDAAFNLELQYWDPPTGKPYIKYWFYRKDGKPMNTHVTLKRNIRLRLTDVEWVDDAGVGLEPGESRKEGTIQYKELLGFTTTPRDYYFQFQ